jgi:hypothetical protein
MDVEWYLSGLNDNWSKLRVALPAFVLLGQIRTTTLLYTGGTGIKIPTGVAGRPFTIDLGAKFNFVIDAKCRPCGQILM